LSQSRPEPDEPVVYDLVAWSPEQRENANFRLRSLEIPFSWDGPFLTVAPSYEGEVDELVDEIDEHPPALGDLPEDAFASEIVERPFDEVQVGPQWRGQARIAGRWRRLSGNLLDGLIIGTLVSGPARRAGLWWPVFVASAVYLIATTAIWGRTLGKWIVGTRVIDDDTGRNPSWLRSIVRYVVPSLGSLLALAVSPRWVAALLSTLWATIVYAPLLWSPRVQGIHDRAARTVVVLTR